MKRKQKRFLQMTLLFTAALIFLPDIGLWALYKEKQLLKPAEGAEAQVGLEPPGGSPALARGSPAPLTGSTAPLRAQPPLGLSPPADEGCGMQDAGCRSTCARPAAAPGKQSCESIPVCPAGLPGKGRAERAQGLPPKSGDFLFCLGDAGL